MTSIRCLASIHFRFPCRRHPTRIPHSHRYASSTSFVVVVKELPPLDFEAGEVQRRTSSAAAVWRRRRGLWGISMDAAVNPWIHQCNPSVTSRRSTIGGLFGRNTLWAVGHKKRDVSFCDNSGKYWPIFVIFSLLYTTMNCGIRTFKIFASP